MLNILELIFLSLAFLVTFTGFLINHFERYVPEIIIQGYKYGSFAHRGSNANYLSAIEIPKSYYRHFYVFSSLFSSTMLFYMYLAYFRDYSVHPYVPAVFKFFLEKDKTAVTGLGAFVSLSLLTLQSWRRLYETYYLQVFAKSSKMNLSHYIAGLVHYFGCVIAIVGQAPLFCVEGQQMVWTNVRTSSLYIPLSMIFILAWYEQYSANVIFANLRKDGRTGRLVTEEHRIPMGGKFDYVSSPHRLAELVMYTVVFCLVPTTTFFCIYLWVVSNQIQTAIQAHEWYKKTFNNYPKNRYAIIPWVI